MFGRAAIRLGIGPHSSYTCSPVTLAQWPSNSPLCDALGQLLISEA